MQVNRQIRSEFDLRARSLVRRIVTKKVKIRTEHVRGSVKVSTRLSDKEDDREMAKVVRMYVKRREKGTGMLTIMVDAPAPGKRWRGRQKTRWKDSCKRDMESLGLKCGEIYTHSIIRSLFSPWRLS